MITLNGKKFAQSEKEFTDSLFNTGSTCVGYARKNRKSVTLMDHNKQKIGVINSHGVLCCATKLPNGKYWYSHADIKLIGRFTSHAQEVSECKKALNP